MKNVAISVFGAVQGVGFRFRAAEKARELRLSGFAENRPDGSVYMEIRGGDFAVEQFVAWCTAGPPSAKIDRVDVHDAEGKREPLSGFSIR